MMLACPLLGIISPRNVAIGNCNGLILAMFEETASQSVSQDDASLTKLVKMTIR
jgi:hypothetical protein